MCDALSQLQAHASALSVSQCGMVTCAILLYLAVPGDCMVWYVWCEYTNICKH